MRTKLFGGRSVLRAALALALLLAATQVQAAINVGASGTSTASVTARKDSGVNFQGSGVSNGGATFVDVTLSDFLTTLNYTYDGTNDINDFGGNGLRLIQSLVNSTGRAIRSLTLTLSPAETFYDSGYSPAVVTVNEPARTVVSKISDLIVSGPSNRTIELIFGPGGWAEGAANEIDLYTPIQNISTGSFQLTITATPVPEPATLTMCGIFGLSAAGAGYLKKRRKGAAVA